MIIMNITLYTITYEQELEIDEAIVLLSRQPSELDYSANNIGFKTKVEEGFIHFINIDNDIWLFDIPIYAETGKKYDWRWVSKLENHLKK